MNDGASRARLMNNQPAEILRTLLAEQGRALLDAPERCSALLQERCGTHKREIHLLGSALRAGIPHALQTEVADATDTVQTAVLVQRLHDELGMDPDLAAWTVAAWALALEVLADAPVVPSPASPAPLESPAPPQIANATPNRLLFTVASDGSGDYCNLSQAIAQAPAGARIQVQPGIYRESITLNKPLELIGRSEVEAVVLEAQDNECLLLRSERALISGFTLHSRRSAGKERRYPAVAIETGQPILESCTISSDSGVGVLIHGAAARPTLRHCRVYNCRENGIFIYDYAQGLIEDCAIFANTLANVAIEEGGNPILRRCQIYEGQETGIYVWGKGRGLIEDCEIFTNALAGVAIEQSANLALRRCRVHDNRECGVYLWDQGKALLEDCEIFTNVLPGVTITEGGNIRCRRCKIHEGQSAGIEVWERGDGIVEDCDIFANATAGVLIQAQGQLAVRGCRINHNRRHGLRIETEGYAAVEDCDLSRNAFGSWKIAEGSRLKSINNREQSEALSPV